MKVTILGLGLIGGSLALDLKERGFATRVIGVDTDARHAAEALALGLVDETSSLEKALATADLVILAVPVDAIARCLPRTLDLVTSDATVTDMGSTKGGICQAVANHPRRAQYVPSHPMAGTEHSGPAAALRDLFQGKTAVICDAGQSGKKHLELVTRLYQAVGMRLVYQSSAEHDLHVAYVSHLSHAISFVLANTVLKKEKDVTAIFDLAGGGFESTVRLAKSSPAMWAPIFNQNRANVLQALEGYIEQLQEFRTALIEDRLSPLMSEANRIRDILTSLKRGE
jgi:prephenate dehydrogenase